MLQQMRADVRSSARCELGRSDSMHLEGKKNFEIILVTGEARMAIGERLGWETSAEEISTGMGMRKCQGCIQRRKKTFRDSLHFFKDSMICSHRLRTLVRNLHHLSNPITAIKTRLAENSLTIQDFVNPSSSQALLAP